MLLYSPDNEKIIAIPNKTAGVKKQVNKRRVKMDRRSKKPVGVIFNMGLNVSYSPHFMCTPVQSKQPQSLLAYKALGR
jgi:hypothetical protein